MTTDELKLHKIKAKAYKKGREHASAGRPIQFNKNRYPDGSRERTAQHLGYLHGYIRGMHAKKLTDLITKHAE